ncbi:MAG: class I SAM-dependent methyltransferase, partial [Niabella sp.]|nr:class I SAM-dependent methyltransferase [Niabella sp.]
MLRKIIASRFKKPTGIIGKWAAGVMIKNNRSKYETLIKDLDLRPGDKLLEIGYGPGDGMHLIAEKYPGCIIHGIDFSPLMYK